MRNVMVVFHLPGGGLAYCSLFDLGKAPSANALYVFKDQLYRVTDILESLGRNADGSRIGASKQLKDLVQALAGLTKNPAQAIEALAGMQNIGEPVKAEGSDVILKVQTLFDEADHIVLVNTVRVGPVPKIDDESLAKQLGMLHPAKPNGAKN